MKLFIDTNVLIDFLTDRREMHENSMRFLSLTMKRNHSMIVNSISLANADFLLKKYYDVSNFPERFLLLGKQFLVCNMNHLQAYKAIASNWKDFEDALQYQSALAAQCDFIITRDKKGFKNSSITILTPEDFLDEYK